MILSFVSLGFSFIPYWCATAHTFWQGSWSVLHCGCGHYRGSMTCQTLSILLPECCVWVCEFNTVNMAIPSGEKHWELMTIHTHTSSSSNIALPLSITLITLTANNTHTHTLLSISMNMHFSDLFFKMMSPPQGPLKPVPKPPVYHSALLPLFYLPIVISFRPLLIYLFIFPPDVGWNLAP